MKPSNLVTFKMNRTLLSFCCCVAILFFANTNTQAQAPLYSKYKDTLVIGVAGVSMNLTAVPSATHTASFDATWATATQTGNQIKVTVTQTNDTYAERIGHVYVEQGGTPTDTIVFLQPGRACEKGVEGTSGKRFWVSFLENILAAPNTFKLELVATSSQGATGTISNPNTGYSSSFTVAANETTTLPIDHATLRLQAYNSVGETKNKLALFVETDANITLYALNYEQTSSDAANILPIEVLGNEYYTLSYNSNRTGANSGTPEEFLIVATENNTLITIVPTTTTGGDTGTKQGKIVGDPFCITLQEGETYLVKALMNDSVRINNYFYKSTTGTYIKSNKSIAVFSGHKRAKIGCDGTNNRDDLYDQLRPIHLWGYRYAVISTGQPRDLYRVLAAHDNTIITINGIAQPPLNRTEYRDYDLIRNDSPVAFIESDKPISVAQMGVSQDCMSKNTGDPYLLMLNPVENQIFDITFTPFPTREVVLQHFVAILVNKGTEALTQLINKATNDTLLLNFIDIAGQDYSYAVTSIQEATHSLHNDRGFIAFSFGYGNAESYAYSVGGRFNTLAAPDFNLDAAYCLGDMTITQFNDTLDFAHGYNWYDSPSTAIPLATIPIISTAVAGEFVYYLSKTVECSESPRRKITILIRPLPEFTFDTDLSTACNTPYPFELILPTGGTYTCLDTYHTCPGCKGDGHFYPRDAGHGSHDIRYTYEDQYGCVSSIDTTIMVLPIVGNPKIEAMDTTAFCAGDSVILRAISTTIADAFYFQWLRSDTIMSVGDTLQTLTVKESGIYTLAIYSKDNCASDSVSNAIEVIAYELPSIPLIPEADTAFCDGGFVELTVESERAIEYQWYCDGVPISGETNSTLMVTQLGSHSYTVAVWGEGDCPAEDMSNVVEVEVYELPQIPVVTPLSAIVFCDGDSVILVATSARAVKYQWYRNDVEISTDTFFVATQSGQYYVEVWGEGDCPALDRSNVVDVFVHELPSNPVIYPSTLQNRCDGDSVVFTVQSARAIKYQWYTNGVAVLQDTLPTLTVKQSGSYTVDVWGAGDCPALTTSNTVEVVVHKVPSIPDLTARSVTEFCKGLSVILDVYADDVVSYEWYRNGNRISGVSGSSYTVVESGSYTVKALGSGNCYAEQTSNEIVVTVYELPTNPIISPSDTINLCDGQSVLLTVTSVGAEYFQWFKNGVAIPLGVSSTYLVYDPGKYTVEVISIEQCVPEENSNAVQVIVIALPGDPVLIPQSATDFCEGESVVLKAEARNATSFEWYKDNVLIAGVTGDTCRVFETGDYYVKAIGGGDCYAQFISNEVRVIVRKNPLIPTIYPSPAPPYYYGVDYRLNLSPTENGVRYKWYKDGVFIGELGISHFIPILKDINSGLYYVEAINEYCMVLSPDFILAPIVMPELFIPNVFTPNGDGINDNFRILGIEAFTENELTVINKRGKLVYSKKYYDNSWYGEGQPDDIYYYYFVAVSLEGVTTTHRGYVYIKREK